MTRRARDSLCIGRRGDLNVLLFPSVDSGFVTNPLPWDLWAFRLGRIGFVVLFFTQYLYVFSFVFVFGCIKFLTSLC